MKAQVIFYSALAFLLDLVASIPYAADLQRYSNQYQSRPSLESKFQTIPQQPYQNFGQRPYDGVYNNPAPQFQEQELPRINRDHYFRNQQYYLNKGPPQIQPEVPNQRLINQQIIQNQHYPNNNFQEAILQKQVDNWRGANQQINENQPVNVAYPEVSVDERDTKYRNYPQQVIQHNRYPENVRNEEREVSSPVEEPYPYRQNPAFNVNHELIGNGSPQQANLAHQAPTRKLHPNHLTIVKTSQQQSRPEILNEETFSPSIPSVPPRNSYLGKDVLKRVNDHYLQVEPVVEHPIPVVPPPPYHVEYGTPLSASERHLARAGNPVEQIPEPQVQQKPNAEHYFTNPRIQNVLSTTKHKKRYLVIHPDGRIEHVDNLEAIAKQHPKYVLVNAGDIVPKTVKHETVDKASVITSPAQPVQENHKPTNTKTVPAIKKTVPSFTYEAPSFEVDVLVNKPSTHVLKPISTATPASVPLTTTHVPFTPKTPPVIAKTTVAAPVTSTPKGVAIASALYTKAIPSAHQAAPSPPSPQTETTKFTPEHSYAPVPQIATTTPTSQEQTTTPPKEVATASALYTKAIPFAHQAAPSPPPPQTETTNFTPEHSYAHVPQIANTTPTSQEQTTTPPKGVATASALYTTAIASAHQAAPTPPPPHTETTNFTPEHSYAHVPQIATTTPTSQEQTTTPPKGVATASALYTTEIASDHQATPTPPPPQTETTDSTPVHASAHVPHIETTTPTSQEQTTTPNPLPQTTAPAPLESSTAAPSPSTPKNIQPSEVEIDKEVLPPHLHYDTDEPVKQPDNVPEEASPIATESNPVNDIQSTSETPAVPYLSENLPQITPHSIPTTESSPPSTSNVEEETSTTPPVTECTPQPDTTTSPPVTESTPEQDKTTVTVVELEAGPQDTTTDSENSDRAPLVVPILYDPEDESPKDIDEFILEEASENVKPNTDEEVPDFGDSDVLEKVPQKPAIWFRTSDPNFWAKLMKKNTDFDVVYFFQIHNQPKIVQDKKTTIFANGTILEEFTETSWEFEGAEPKVTKTSKLTNPEEQ